MQTWYIIPLVIITIINAYLSAKASNSQIFFYILFATFFIPFWPFIAKYSKNIILDAMIYDSLVAVVYAVALLFFTDVELKPNLVIGTILTVIGIVLIAK